MAKSRYSVIGVMSGTSLDGVDVIQAKFQFDDTWDFEIIHTETISYTELWYNILKNLRRIYFFVYTF